LPSYRQNQADNLRSPVFTSGDLLSVYVGDRGGGPFERRSRPVNGPLSLAFDSVNKVFAILFHWAEKWLKSAGFVGRFCDAAAEPNAASGLFLANPAGIIPCDSLVCAPRIPP